MMHHYLKHIVKYLPRIIAGLLILNIFGFDLFTNQTVFLLDYVPAPIRVWERSHYISVPWIWTIHDGLLLLLWYIRWSKIYLLSIAIITLLLWYRRWQYLTWDKSTNKIDKSESHYLPLLGMILMVFNPVFSSRMGTQPWVWLGIILLGRGLYWLIRHRDHLTTKHSIIIGAFWWVAMMSMNHASFMILVCLTMLVLVIRSWRSLRSSLMIAAVVWILNLNWIIGWLIGANTVIEWATTFSQQNIEEFMTYGQSWLWPVVTSVLGYGFRWEKYGSAYAPTWSNPRWRVAWWLLLCIAWYGLILWYRRDRKQSLYLWWIMLVSVILGVGIASDMLGPLIQRLYDHVPWYRGLREPHKWIGLYIMIIIPLLLYGYESMTTIIRKYLSLSWWLMLCSMIAFAWSPGSARQLMMRYDATSYPSSYSQTRDFLMDQPWTGQWLQLPRHSYHRCQRTHKVISNPTASYMYPASVITSDNIEVWQLYTNSINPRSRDVDAFVTDHDLSHLSGHNIQWIIYLSQCADFKSYEWIMTHSWLLQIGDYGDVQIYTIQDK